MIEPSTNGTPTTDNPGLNGTPPTSAKPTEPKKQPEWWLMTKKLFQQGTVVASFAPSSSYLSRTIIRGLDFENAKVIVELGAGTGPVTTEIVKKVKPGTRVLIIEQDADFCSVLRQKFPTYDVIQGDAGLVTQYLDERGLDMADHVISGLPMPSLPADLRDRILEGSHERLRPGGEFRQLTCMPWVFQMYYRRFFRKVKFNFVPWNLPPAGVYICREYIPLAQRS
jgi:phospholipid N-methyltransferase